jgi:hypothetical protein
VPAADVPETGQTVDIAIAIGIDQMRAFRFHPDLAISMARILMQRVNHVFLVLFDKGAIAEWGVHIKCSLF